MRKHFTKRIVKLISCLSYLITMCSLGSVVAQTLIQDLKRQYDNSKQLSPERFQLTGKYAQVLFFNEQQEKSLKILESEIKQASNLKDGRYAAYLYTILAINNRILEYGTLSQSNINSAKIYVNKTNHAETKGYVKYGEGWLAARNNKEVDAVAFFLQALSYLEQAPVSSSLATRKSSIYKELTSIYANWNEYELQEKYGKLSLELAVQQKDVNAVFEAYMSMGYMYEQQFIESSHIEKYRNEAEKYYLWAIDIYNRNSEKITFSSNLPYVANNLANLYLRFYPLNYRDKVKYYAEIAKKTALEADQHNFVASSYGILAELALHNEDLGTAKSYLLSSLIEINTEPLADQQILLSIYENLSDIYEREGSFGEALRYYKLYVNTFTAIYNKEKLGLSKRLEAQYEKEKHLKDVQNLQLESERKEQQIKLMHALGIQQRQELENFRLREENNIKKLELSRMEASQQKQALRLSKLESESRANEALNYRNELSYKENLNRFFTLITATCLLLLVLLYYAYKQRTNRMKQQERLHVLELDKERHRTNIATLTALLEGQEQERGRLARDLHDGLGGLLSGTKLQLSQINGQSDKLTSVNLNKSIQQIDLAVDELRRVAHNLMPDLLQTYGLNEALHDYASRMSNETTDIHVQFLGYHTAMHKDQELITYRIIQELVNNALKHAKPSQVIIQIVEESDLYNITVEDDGKGFQVDMVKANNSAGLHNINSRISFLKGKIEISSSLDLGTSIEFQFPKQKEND